MAERVIHLIRHPEVELKYKTICYGQTDVAWSEGGRVRASELADLLSKMPITHAFRSPLSRTALPIDFPITITGDLSEIHFGEWENQAWDAIYARTGSAMEGFIHRPAEFAPPGGETMFQLRDRVLNWYRALPETGVIVAITHGGPIAALRGTLQELPVIHWPSLIPKWGEIVTIS